ncbi:MAG: NAD-dependent succinate-semialdehyde dehydrogenase [Microbacteriaceae bacterium]|nr:NAD-dependent succinate-semialdehyde dehydrogenase [Microbacteriaceae bacterium]
MSGFAVVDPYTLERSGEVPFFTAEQIEAAVASVWTAWNEWVPATTVAERAALIARVADLHEERVELLADTIVREMGKPRPQAVGEAEFAAAIYRFYADNAERLLADEPIEGAAAEAYIRKSPTGPLLGIMPWNFPYYQVARFAGPNLVVGNPILLKHAPQCPESAALIEQIFRDAGVPAGGYTNLVADNEQIAQIIADQRIRGVSLTGSERAGTAVAEVAGRHLKKVVLELGGSDPFIVLSTDDLDAVVDAAFDGRFDNNGQSCNAPKRFIVADGLYEDFASKLTAKMAGVSVGDPKKEDTVLGPLSSELAAIRLEDQVQRALAAGATARLAPKPRDGAKYAPVVLEGITPQNPAYREEFFGPVASLYRVAGEAEAIELANATDFGLGSYVWTTDREQALRVADRLETGMVYVNTVLADSPELPFGGTKRSGTGREMGALGIEEFINKKLVYIAS